jgi:hypothetical protein
MSDALDLMQLGAVKRAAIGTLKGMHIATSDTMLNMTIFSKVPWCRTHERVALDGSVSTTGRRDLRGGASRVRAGAWRPGCAGRLAHKHAARRFACATVCACVCVLWARWRTA